MPLSPTNPDVFLYTLALVGVVILVSALFSGVIEKTGVPQVAVFLGMGALIGPGALGLIDAGVDSPILRSVATLSLALVLFTDAVSLDLTEVRKNKLLATLVLGPGTLFSGVLIAVLAWMMLGWHPALAAILGAALSSTDPVLLRSFLRRPDLDGSVRQALRLESGMNDAVLLPIVIVASALYTLGRLSAGEWLKLAGGILVLSPAIGALVALLAIRTLEFVRIRAGIRRDYESIYSLGVAFAAFAAAEAVHGSGFLAAFAAGLTISALDVELCDCFLEYGETTAEMALLFTFVLFGTSVIWTGLQIISPLTLGFTALVFLARPVAFFPALLPAHTAWQSRGLIAWFGPRGLSSLLLVMLPVFSGLREAAQLVPICSLVVLCSVVVHGFSPMFIFGRKRRPAHEDPVAAHGPEVADEPQNTDTGFAVADPGYISIEEYRRAQRVGVPTLVVDSRTGRTFLEDEKRPANSVRVDPEKVSADARGIRASKDAVLVTLCA